MSRNPRFMHEPPCGKQYMAGAAPEMYDACIQARSVLHTIYQDIPIAEREGQKAKVILAKIVTLSSAINAAAGVYRYTDEEALRAMP